MKPASASHPRRQKLWPLALGRAWSSWHPRHGHTQDIDDAQAPWHRDAAARPASAGLMMRSCRCREMHLAACMYALLTRVSIALMSSCTRPTQTLMRTKHRHTGVHGEGRDYSTLDIQPVVGCTNPPPHPQASSSQHSSLSLTHNPSPSASPPLAPARPPWHPAPESLSLPPFLPRFCLLLSQGHIAHKKPPPAS